MEAVRKHLISHHTCLMEQLESEYMNYINQLLIRKSKLVIKMQEEFYKELNTLNTLCVQRHRQSNDIPRFTPTTFETDDIQNGSTSSTKHPSQINSTPIEFINDIVCDEEATQHTSPSIQSHAVHSDTLNDVDSDHSTIYESKSIYIVNREYTSSQCDKVFPCQSQLKMHVRTHTGQRPYKCSYADCSKAFKGKSNLANHIRTHTGERPYKCNYTDCSKAFKQTGALNVHIRTHTGEKPYECNVCKKRFARSETRAVHLKGVHGIDKRKKS
eukprot:26459_1